MKNEGIKRVKDIFGNQYELGEEVIALDGGARICRIVGNDGFYAVVFDGKCPLKLKELQSMKGIWSEKFIDCGILWPISQCCDMLDSSICGFLTPVMELPENTKKLSQVLLEAGEGKLDPEFLVRVAFGLATVMLVVHTASEKYLMGTMETDDYYIDSDGGVYSLGAYKYAIGNPRVKTTRYLAPEAILEGDNPRFTLQSDCYALAAVIFELITGEYPFGSSRAGEFGIDTDTENMVINGESVFYYEGTEHCEKIKNTVGGISKELLELFERTFNYCGKSSYTMDRPAIKEWWHVLKDITEKSS